MAYPSTLTDGSWQERAFVTIIRKDDEKKADLHGLTDEMGWADGMRDFDGEPTANGGRIRERQSQDDSTFNMTLWQIGAVADEFEDMQRPKGVEEFFYESEDLTPEQAYTTYGTSTNREDFILVVLWTNDPSVNSATDEVQGEDYIAHRRIADMAQFIDATPEWNDRVLKLEAEMKWSPFDPVGDKNFFTQDYDGDVDALDEVTVDYVEQLKAGTLNEE